MTKVSSKTSPLKPRTHHMIRHKFRRLGLGKTPNFQFYCLLDYQVVLTVSDVEIFL